MQQDKLTPEELKAHLKNPLNFVSFVFEYHVQQVIKKLNELGYKEVTTEAGAKLKLESLIQAKNPNVFKAIDVDPKFEGLNPIYTDVVYQVIQGN